MIKNKLTNKIIIFNLLNVASSSKGVIRHSKLLLKLLPSKSFIVYKDDTKIHKNTFFKYKIFNYLVKIYNTIKIQFIYNKYKKIKNAVILSPQHTGSIFFKNNQVIYINDLIPLYFKTNFIQWLYFKIVLPRIINNLF